MAGNIRLFEKTAAGLLVEVDPARADAVRAGRRASSMNVVIDVLLTPEEEAARDLEQARFQQQQAATFAAAQEKAAARDAAVTRLQALGISEADLKAITNT